MTSHSFAPRGGRPRRGVMLVLSTFLMIVMFAFAAFAIDLGLIVLTQAQLQNAADAAALAAVLELKTADPSATRESLRQAAVEQAIAVAALNRAAGRSVAIGPNDIVFGNRHFDPESGKWRSFYEGDDQLENLPLNAVQVTITFDQKAGARRQLDLYCARALGHKAATVVGTSRSHLTPRDLAFVLDVSGSMKYDTHPGDGSPSALIPILFGFITSNHQQKWFSSSEYSGDRDPDGNGYRYLWRESVREQVWGNATDAAAFAAQEFPGSPVDPHSGEVRGWEHWKWRAYCDYTCHPNTDRNWLYNNVNRNVVRNRNEDNRMSLERYCRFLIENSLIPAIAGQRFYPRDADKDFVLDSFPPPEARQPGSSYPAHPAYYPMPQELDDYDPKLLYQGGVFTANYPGDVDVRPMSFVRKATLFGIYAMISDENFGNDAFDQVGMITYGTLAYRQLELTNNLPQALKVANCRLTMGIGQLGINPVVNGHTNIGMALRQGIKMLRYSPRSRVYTNKTIALLTDGIPNISPRNGFASEELHNDAYSTDIRNNGSLGVEYARYWAEECAREGIVVHTIIVGNSANSSLMQDMATMTGGVSFEVTDPAANTEQLNNIFIAIGKDKLGKLYLD